MGRLVLSSFTSKKARKRSSKNWNSKKRKRNKLKYHNKLLHSFLGKWYRIRTLMSVVFCHKSALFKRGIFVLQHMTNTESVAIEPPLLTKFLAVTTKQFPIQRWRVNVFSFKHDISSFSVLSDSTNVYCERNKFPKIRNDKRISNINSQISWIFNIPNRGNLLDSSAIP